MDFEVRTDLSREEFEAYYHFNQRVHAPFIYWFGKIGGIVAVLAAIILTVDIVVNRLWTNRQIMTPYCIFIVLLIALPFVNRWMISRLYKANSTMLKAEYRFGGSGVRTGTGEASSIYTWPAFRELYHSKGVYYLFIDTNHAMILPERSFTQGEPAAFGPYMAEKTGQEMKEIK
jgi:hypothetical protein